MPKRRERKVLIRVVFLVGLRMLCCAPRIFLTPALWTAVYCCLLMYSCRAGNRSYKLYLPRHRERVSDFKQWSPQQALHADYIFSGIPAMSLGWSTGKKGEKSSCWVHHVRDRPRQRAAWWQ